MRVVAGMDAVAVAIGAHDSWATTDETLVARL